MALVNLMMTSYYLNMDIEVAVYLPENTKTLEEYHPNKKYPVIYCLHGYRSNYMAWINRSMLPMIARKYECIVVMPDARNSFYTRGKNGFNYYDFISKELPIKIANFFPASIKKEDSFIMGASMGGYGALLLAMTNPDKYAAAYSFSGALDFQYQDGVVFGFDQRMSSQAMGAFGSAEEFEQSDYCLRNLLKKFDQLDGDKPRLKMICGTEDRLCYKYNEDLIQFIRENTSLDVEYETGPGDHDYYFWSPYIEDAYHFFGFK